MTHPGLLITTHKFLIPHGTLNEGLSNFCTLPLFILRICEEQNELKTNNYNNQSVLKRSLKFFKIKNAKEHFWVSNV
jgi:hypothetical protein